MLKLRHEPGRPGRIRHIQVPSVRRGHDNSLQQVQEAIQALQVLKMRLRGSVMGKVAVSLKIMPESPDTDLEKVKSEIAKMAQLSDAQIEPVAFGLKALKILIIVPDSNFDGLEDKIKTISGVSEVEVESSTLI